MRNSRISYERVTNGPVCAPPESWQAREYQPRYPVGYVPRERDGDPIGLQVHRSMVRRPAVKPSPDVSPGQLRVANEQRHGSLFISQQERLRQVLEEADEPLTAYALAERLGVKLKAARGALARLAAKTGQLRIEKRRGSPTHYSWIKARAKA
jgi:hypothetical protein